MPPNNEIAKLGKLIAVQHGWAAAKAFKSYELNEADQAVLSRCAIDLLKIFPPVPGACALLSAALAVALERHMNAPIHVVAGSLEVEGVPVLGDRQFFDGTPVFSTPNPHWDGHAWVMVGCYVVDIAIFRTAYSNEGPPRLAQHIDLTFGPGKALYVDHWKRTRRVGLGYELHYVLSEGEVNNLMGCAFHLIDRKRHAPLS